MKNKKRTNLSPFRKRIPTPNGRVHKKPTQIYDFHEADDRLFDLFRNHGFIDYPHEKRHQLVRFYQLLMERQKTDNLTRLVQFKDIAIKHFIDCLIVPQFLNLKFPLMDLGSGPGFPGIPLKIHYPDESIILAEGVKKRVDFLTHVQSSLELKKLEIFPHNVGKRHNCPVSMVITRAVTSITETLKWADWCLDQGGNVVLMKGPNVRPEIEEAKQTHPNYKLKSFKEYILPHSIHKRTLCVYEKTVHSSRIK